MLIFMTDAVEIAFDLAAEEAERLQAKETVKLKKSGEAQDGRCVGIRHTGRGLWSVYVGYQDGEPVTEPPTMRRATRKTTRKSVSLAAA